MKIFMTKWVATLLLVMPLGLLADDMDDVMAVIEAYGDLEGDLAAQAELMHIADMFSINITVTS